MEGEWAGKEFVVKYFNGERRVGLRGEGREEERVKERDKKREKRVRECVRECVRVRVSAREGGGR